MYPSGTHAYQCALAANPCPIRVQSEFTPYPNRARGSFGSTPVHANVRYEDQAGVSSAQG